jgi:hypothetical protein
LHEGCQPIALPKTARGRLGGSSEIWHVLPACTLQMKEHLQEVEALESELQRFDVDSLSADLEQRQAELSSVEQSAQRAQVGAFALQARPCPFVLPTSRNANWLVP